MTGTIRLITRYGFIMCVFAVVSAAILAMTYQVTEPKRRANLSKAEFAARKELFPDATQFVPARSDSYTFWKALNADKKVSGYILKAVRRGYSSDIETLIAINPDFSVVSIKILSQAETPGLGTLIVKEQFTRQFRQLSGTAVAVRKDGGKIDAVTGATISSRAVANSVREEIAAFKKVLKTKG